jgi:hypothetical protein
MGQPVLMKFLMFFAVVAGNESAAVLSWHTEPAT